MKKNEARVIKHDFTIETKKLEQHYELFRMDEVSESLNKAISSMYHVPIVNLIENELNEQEKNTDLMDFVSIINVKNNRKVFGVGDEENRKKRNFYSNYGLGLSINFSIFFKYIWEQLIADGLTLRMVKEKMLNWEYFEEDTKKIIEVGVERFWNEDYVSAIHILVPQFENSFRTFFHLGKNPTTVIRKETTQQEQVFGQFLEQKFVKDNIDENMLFMIKYVLTEELGYNLRNNIAHGLESLENMDKGRTLIIIYLYLLMTLYRWEVKNEDMN